MIKESSGNCYPINEVQYICHDIASIVIESLNEINCMKVSPHAVEIYDRAIREMKQGEELLEVINLYIAKTT